MILVIESSSIILMRWENLDWFPGIVMMQRREYIRFFKQPSYEQLPLYKAKSIIVLRNGNNYLAIRWEFWILIHHFDEMGKHGLIFLALLWCKEGSFIYSNFSSNPHMSDDSITKSTNSNLPNDAMAILNLRPSFWWDGKTWTDFSGIVMMQRR